MNLLFRISLSRLKIPSREFLRHPLIRGMAGYLLLWTMLVWGGWVVNVKAGEEHVYQQVLTVARTSISKDLTFRWWAAGHGGVYVPINADTQPNPYLPPTLERDIETPLGKKLTLMNPAYMMRQLTSSEWGDHGEKSRITSLKPLNPDNTPDPWERKALESFERGDKEFVEMVNGADGVTLRLMRPLMVQEECLKCHVHQGYSVGDVRGGMGVSIPMKYYQQMAGHARMNQMVSFFLIWLLGSGGIVLLKKNRYREAQARHLAEEKLRQSQSNLVRAQELAHVGSWHWDLQTGEMYWSDEMYRICGVDAESFKPSYEAFMQLVQSDSRGPVQQESGHFPTDPSGLFTSEYVIVRPDGVSHYVREVWEIIADHQGIPQYMVGIVQDITEQEQVRNALMLEKQRMEHYWAISQNVIVRLDDQGRVVFVNEVGCRTLGYPLEEIVGKSWVDTVVPQEERQEVQGVLGTLLSENHRGMSVYDNYIIGKDGSKRYFIWNNATERDADDRVTGTISVGDDVTTIREYMDRLRRNNALIDSQKRRLSGMFETALDAIIVMDSRGFVKDINPAAVSLFGFAKDALVGYSLSDKLVPSPMCQAHSDALVRRLADPGKKLVARRLEAQGMRADGVLVDLEIAITEMVENDDVMYTAFIRDVTDRKQLLKSLNDTLSVAQSANTAKSEFLANMSHEIRSPMNAIMGMTELVLTSPELPESLREYMEIIQQSSGGLLGVINSILDFSKIEAGQLMLEHIVFDVVKQVEDACETMAINARQKQLELFCLIEDEVPLELLGDPLRFRQILINLINNAIKFTLRGEIVVRVQTIPSKEEQTGQMLKVSVTDTGIGIAPDKVGEIFQAFTQADGSTTRRFGGTGLGLSISRRLVDLMGGEIWVESQEGKGSVFQFTVHFATEEAKKFSPGGGATPLPLEFDGLRVLVFDPNPTGRHVVSTLVRYVGAQAHGVASWQVLSEELRVAKQTACPFDLLLVDSSVATEADAWDLFEQECFMTIHTIWLKPMNVSSDTIRASRCLTNPQYVNKPARRSSLLLAMRQALGYEAREMEVANSVLHVSEQQGASIRILLVEDQVNNQKLAMEILHSAGHHVTPANDGVEALEILAQQSFDLVLMDLNMPKMNGFETIRHIRNSDDSGGVDSRVPIVAVTATILADAEETCADMGIHGYLLKPYRPTELLRAVEPFTRKRRPRAKKGTGVATIIVADGDRETLEHNRNLWLMEAPGHLARLELLMQQQSVAEIMSEIRWFLDAAGNTGAPRVKNRALRLKGKIELRDWLSVSAGLRELTQELAEVKNVLTAGDGKR